MNQESNPAIQQFSLNSKNYSFISLDQLREVALDVQSNKVVRVLAIELSVDSQDPGKMGPWPNRIAHRLVKGDHGAGPIVEQDLIMAIRAVLKPTLAIIRGNLCDFAIDIASACDIRIAIEGSTISDSRVKNGQTAASGITYMLPRLIGLSQAMRISLLGEALSATEAHRIQFVHDVLPQDRAERDISSYVERLAKMPTRAWEVHKMQVLPQLDQDFETSMVHSLGIRQTHVIKDRMEGIKAWRERRDPEFTGE